MKLAVFMAGAGAAAFIAFIIEGLLQWLSGLKLARAQKLANIAPCPRR